MNILFLTNLLPYPLDNGGKIKTYTILRSLKNEGHCVDLLCFKESLDCTKMEESDLLEICENIQQVYQRLTTVENKKYMMFLAVKSLFSKYGVSTYKFISKEMRHYILSWKTKKYDIIYIDHLPMYVYSDLCRKLWPEAKLILDEHNCEATILRRKAESTVNPLKKAFMFFEAKKVERFESQSVLSADKVIVLSEVDYDTLRASAKKDFIHAIIPIGVVDRGTKKQRTQIDDVLNILFVGTMTWEPNNHGLIWFLDNVIPLMEHRKMKYKLYIVGKNPSEDVKQRAELYENITITGYVESVDEYYDTCDCMIVPLFIGSGQRVKLIEGFSKGMPAVSTTIGAEGLNYVDGENILIADNADKFVEGIEKMYAGNRRIIIGNNARELYLRDYSPAAITYKLKEALR